MAETILAAPSGYPMADSLSRFGELKAACIPKDLTGRTVLDIGGYDGRFAKLCLDRGAKSALCLDNQEWASYGKGQWPVPQQFEGVEYRKGDFLELTKQFDLVLCFNVLYHCERWLEAPIALRRLSQGEVCISTYWAEGQQGWKEYTEMGTGFIRATPTIPGLLWGLAEAGFKQFPFSQAKDEMIVLRCR